MQGFQEDTYEEFERLLRQYVIEHPELLDRMPDAYETLNELPGVVSRLQEFEGWAISIRNGRALGQIDGFRCLTWGLPLEFL